MSEVVGYVHRAITWIPTLALHYYFSSSYYNNNYDDAYDEPGLFNRGLGGKDDNFAPQPSPPPTTSSSSSSGGGSSTEQESPDVIEFVAFLLWYMFLVCCCVVPTCCAYRRRRLVEARLAQHQANLNRFHHSNMFILSNLQARHDSERLREERTRVIAEELQKTTMKIQEDNMDDSPTAEVSVQDSVVASDMEEANEERPPDECSDVDAPKQNEEKQQVERKQVTEEKTHDEPGDAQVPKSLYQVEPDHIEDNGVILIPDTYPNGGRAVSGTCAICLCPYEVGDEITWSSEPACKHAFHNDCVVPWLSKKEEAKCPVCRQDFCPSSILEGLAVPPAPTATAAYFGGGMGDRTFAELQADMFLESFAHALATSRSRIEIEFEQPMAGQAGTPGSPYRLELNSTTNREGAAGEGTTQNGSPTNESAPAASPAVIVVAPGAATSESRSSLEIESGSNDQVNER